MNLNVHMSFNRYMSLDTLGYSLSHSFLIRKKHLLSFSHPLRGNLLGNPCQEILLALPSKYISPSAHHYPSSEQCNMLLLCLLLPILPPSVCSQCCSHSEPLKIKVRWCHSSPLNLLIQSKGHMVLIKA